MVDGTNCVVECAGRKKKYYSLCTVQCLCMKFELGMGGIVIFLISLLSVYAAAVVVCMYLSQVLLIDL